MKKKSRYEKFVGDVTVWKKIVQNQKETDVTLEYVNSSTLYPKTVK